MCIRDENCDLREEIRVISKEVREFRKITLDDINSFKKEIRGSLENIDNRYNRMYDHLETELRGEMIRSQEALSTKVDAYMMDQNNRSLTIVKDLGDIKTALGLKADRDETSHLQSSIMKRFEIESEKAAKERIEIERNANKIGYKLLYLLIGTVSTAFISLLLQYLSNN